MKLLPIVHILISILLIVAILLQQRGTSAGLAFGSDFGSYTTKRGVEKFLMRAAVVLSVLFLLISAARIVAESGGAF